jgi:enoyl-CoA hydratase
MNSYQGQSLSWKSSNQIIELALHQSPCNEIGTSMLAELEKFVEVLPILQTENHALILCSRLSSGFSAGADLKEFWRGIYGLPPEERKKGIRSFLQRIHHVMNSLDMAPILTIAAVHGVTFGGGFELALTCDLIIAEKSTRFCFPELRLGLIPGFGGIPRLKRDIGNAAIRDLLLTGRSWNASKALAIGLVSQLVGEGQALEVSRRTAGQQGKFDAGTRREAKFFIKGLPQTELDREIEIFCDLVSKPALEEGLNRFVENQGPLPYLP